MYLDEITWRPQLICFNLSCNVQPISKYIAIRKTSKINALRIQERIERMINLWNQNNPIDAYEGLQFDFEEIAETEIKHHGLIPICNN